MPALPPGVKPHPRASAVPTSAAALGRQPPSPVVHVAERPRPWGLRVADSINVWYMLALLALLLGYAWCNGTVLHHLMGRDTVVDVLRVVDGDTFVARTVPGGVTARFRLKQIDAPERDQPHGAEAAAALESLLLAPHREVTVFLWEQDPWGRYVVDVAVRDSVFSKLTYVQFELVKRGLAWTFGGFGGDLPFSQALEAAKAAKIGLWKEDNPEEPWNYRRRMRGGGTKLRGPAFDAANDRRAQHEGREQRDHRGRRDKEHGKTRKKSGGRWG